MRKDKKLTFGVSTTLIFLALISYPAAGVDCKKVIQSQKRYAALGAKELQTSISEWRSRLSSENEAAKKISEELNKCKANPKKYAKLKNDPRYADTWKDAQGNNILGMDGKPIACWPLIAARRTPSTEPQIDYQESYQISQVIIYNNPQCFDPGLVVKVQRWIKRHPSALN